MTDRAVVAVDILNLELFRGLVALLADALAELPAEHPIRGRTKALLEHAEHESLAALRAHGLTANAIHLDEGR